MMMMMTAFDSVQNNLNKTLGAYKNLKIMDAVLSDSKTNTQTYDQNKWLTPEHKSSSQDGYEYASNKLAKITEQKEAQFDALKSVLEEIKKDGNVTAQTLQESAGLTRRNVTGRQNETDRSNDDGAAAVNKSKAEVLKDFGLTELVDAKDKDISKEQKRKLAGAYLTQISSMNESIKNDSAKPTFNASTNTATATSPQAALKEYATIKQQYITAVKKGLEDKVIESTDETTATAIYSSGKPNKPFDPQYKTFAGGVAGGTPSAENVAKSEKIAKVKEQLDGIRTQFKKAGIENIDDLLQAEKFEPTNEANTKLNDLKEEQKKKGFSTGAATSSSDEWRPIATKVKTILAEQAKANGDKNTAGITLENFTSKLLEDEAVTATLAKAYTNNTAKPLTSIDNIFNTTTTTSSDGTTTTTENQIAGAEEANRERALGTAGGKPAWVPLSTTRDLGSGAEKQGTLKLNGKDIEIKLGDGEVPIYTDDKKSALAMSEFRGMPAVLSKKGDRFFVRYFNVQKVGNNNASSVLTTAITEIDPKLAFADKAFTKPKKSIDYDMILPDANKRKVVDYYVRSYDQKGDTDSNKVRYVARNFSDNIDRLPVIKNAQYYAAKDADPAFYEAKPKATEKSKEAPISIAIPGATAPTFSIQPIEVTRT